MAKVLLIFVISPNPDPYVNAMAHCVQLHGVDKIVLVQITEPPMPPMIHDFGEFLQEDMWRRIDGLARDQYVKRNPETKQFRETRMSLPDGFALYERLRQLFVDKDQARVNYQYLRQQMIELKRRYHPAEVMVDITGAPKRLAADILASCLATGIKDVFTFELKTERREPIGLLYHNLAPHEYEHVLLPSSAPLVANLTLFSMNQNRIRLTLVIVAILLSMFFAVWNYWFGGRSLLLTSVLVAISAFGGILPLVDILLGAEILQRWV